ncbi:MAG: hypothetical protein KatS3mg068_2002 [Candidatus Sericytochromatia bacterium]|nr:MAG: hypothetical protein KatS3mg068_2002 [Candidatus Sericytochromatia bacterium]
MSVKVCPHCSNQIPTELSSMPVCYICGGDLNATPSQPVWTSIDIKANNVRVCPRCKTEIKSVLTMECPECKMSLEPAGKIVENIEKEKKEFESLVQSSNVREKVNVSEEVTVVRTSPSEIKPYSEMIKEKKEAVSLKEKVKEKRKESFFSKLLRLLGLKKD